MLRGIYLGFELVHTQRLNQIFKLHVVPHSSLASYCCVGFLLPGPFLETLPRHCSRIDSVHESKIISVAQLVEKKLVKEVECVQVGFASQFQKRKWQLQAT